MGKRIDGDELGTLAGGGGEGGNTTFKSCNALFKDIDGGLWRKLADWSFTFFFSSECGGCAHVHDTAVDVTKLLEAKEPRAMSRVIESVALPSLDFISKT